MSVHVFNFTGNRCGFEDEMCDRLKEQITALSKAPVILDTCSGSNLLSSDTTQTGSDIIVVVAHAAPCNVQGHDTAMDIGFRPPDMPQDCLLQLNNPTLAGQLLPRNTVPFIRVYCACSALSAETTTSGIDDPLCIGTISARRAIEYPRDVTLIAEIVAELHRLVRTGSTDHEVLHQAVCAAEGKATVGPGFLYSETPRVRDL